MITILTDLDAVDNGVTDRIGGARQPRRGGLSAAVPEGIALPTDYDPRSGQPWTRSRTDFIPVDLMARSFMV